MMRRLGFALLAVVFAAGYAVADDVKKETKKDAKEAKEDVKAGAKDVKREAKDDMKGAVHKTAGTVKSVTGNTVVVTDDKGKEMTFDVTKDTVVYAKGASHKMSALKADGKPTEVSEFVSDNKHVTVRYSESDGKMTAKDIRVSP
jgi:uncharacterized protein (UPF0333 family)